MKTISYPSIQNNFLYLFAFFVSIIILTPLITIILSNLSEKSDYLNFFSNNQLIDFSINSLVILFFVLFLTFFLGVISAYLVSFFNFPGVHFFKYSLILSFAIPPYIYGYTISAFFENYGTLHSILSPIFGEITKDIIPKIDPYGGSIISLSLTLYGYVFLLTRSSFLNQSPNLIEVGKNLGFTNLDIFFKVILPCAKPAIFVGLSLVAMETLADFGTVSFFGVSTFTTGIYDSWFIFDDLKAANFLSLLLLILVLVFFVLEGLSRRNIKFFNVNNSFKTKNKKTQLVGLKKLLAFIFCFLLFLISFLFPFIQMLLWAFTYTDYFSTEKILKLNINSIKLIVVSSLVIISLSLIVNFGARILKSKVLQFFSSLSISGYAIPGIVISVSVISLFSLIDKTFSLSLKNYFIGTFFGLIFGYCIRFYSISYNTIKTVYLKISTSIDESASLLGYNKFKILKSIHIPLLKKNFIFAFILISIEIFKELPITLILRPFNFETFSTSAFNLASNDLIEAAATPSIFIILWSSFFIILSIKFFLMDKK